MSVTNVINTLEPRVVVREVTVSENSSQDGYDISIDFSIFNTARIFGANKFQAFYYVIFPNIRNGIFSAIFLGFMRSISEFGASMVIAGNISGETQTLSSAIFTAIQIGDSNKIFLLSFISIFLAILTIMTFSIINKNRRFIF